jgi:hypothetical protein
VLATGRVPVDACGAKEKRLVITNVLWRATSIATVIHFFCLSTKTVPPATPANVAVFSNCLMQMFLRSAERSV